MPVDLSAVIGPLSDEIGDAFTADELDPIVQMATMKGLFAEFVGTGLPHRMTAFKLLTALSEREADRMPLFFAHLLQRKPDRRTLRDLILSACPEAAERLIEIKQQLPIVLAGLEAIRTRIAEPAIRQALSQSHKALSRVVVDIERLHVFKTLHDCLHQLQITPFSDQRKAVMRMKDDPMEEQALRDDEERLKIACSNAREAIEDLPDDGQRSAELKWIKQIERASQDFTTALDEKALDRVVHALMLVRHVLRTEPARLSTVIRDTAAELPLEFIAGALKQIGASPGRPDERFHGAQIAIEDLRATLIGRVMEHETWQEADLLIGGLEEELELPLAQAMPFFTLGWTGAKTKFQKLPNLSPQATWAQGILRYSIAVDDELARETPTEALGPAFDRYRRAVRFRFFQVDKELRGDCSRLTTLSSPLRTILETLSDELRPAGPGAVPATV